MSMIGYIGKYESLDGHTLFVRVHHRFDFSLQREFRVACQVRRYSRYVIDLEGIDYIDSAALGMLMMLYRYAGEDQQTIALVRCGAAVMEILRIAHFSQFFDISGVERPAAAPAHEPELCLAG